MAPKESMKNGSLGRKWITSLSATAWIKQARFWAVRHAAAARGSTKMSSNLLRYQCGLSAQCADRCNPMWCGMWKHRFLGTQGPCGSERTCDVDTVTDDTSAQVKDVTPETLGVTFTGLKMSRSEGLGTCGGRKHPKHQSAEVVFLVLGNFTRTNSDFPNIAKMDSSSVGILRPFLFFLWRSPLSVLGFDGETVLSRSHVKDTRTHHFIQLSEVIVFIKQSACIADVSIQRG